MVDSKLSAEVKVNTDSAITEAKASMDTVKVARAMDNDTDNRNILADDSIRIATRNASEAVKPSAAVDTMNDLDDLTAIPNASADSEDPTDLIWLMEVAMNVTLNAVVIVAGNQFFLFSISLFHAREARFGTFFL